MEQIMVLGKETELKDINDKDIEIGDIVEWNDGEGKRTADVIRCGDGQVGFRCFKNSKPNWAIGHVFKMRNFIYSNTWNHLKIIEKGRKSSEVRN